MLRKSEYVHSQMGVCEWLANGANILNLRMGREWCEWSSYEDDDEGNVEGADDYEGELLRDDGDGMDELVAELGL